MLTALVLGVITAPAPAGAQGDSGDTTVTFTVLGGALTINVPAAKDLGAGAAGASITDQLGTVQVVDQRGLLVGSWVASVSSSNFTTGAGAPSETIPNSDVSYWSGPQTASTGVGVPVPGQLTAANAVTLDAERTAFSKLVGVGNNSVSWNPHLVVDIPASAVAGTYTGTVTHSVV